MFQIEIEFNITLRPIFKEMANFMKNNTKIIQNYLFNK
jgi:hypothetical protein